MRVFGIPIFPEQASSFAMDVDALYFFIVAVTSFFALVVAVLVIVLGIKYHRRHEGEVGAHIEGNLPLELLWSVIPTVIAMVMFGWGASVFYHLRRPPEEAMHIYAVGKQWMWKFQHLEGQREINELHVPTGRPIKVTVTSEDVIHSLYFPAFRTKIDAIPGRYTELWFEPTKLGTYHIFCAEYCGTNHSAMIGSVVVMEPLAYQSWLAGGAGGSLAERGAALFNQLACNRPGPRAVTEGHLRQAGGARRRIEGHRGRGLSPRIDPDVAGEDRQGLPAADADVPGPHQRGRPGRAHRARALVVVVDCRRGTGRRGAAAAGEGPGVGGSESCKTHSKSPRCTI
jgi:cytochrome c oxidase subunit II